MQLNINKNEVRFELLPGTKENDLSKGLMNQKLDDINSNMEEDKKQDEDGNEDDHKAATIEKSQDDDNVSITILLNCIGLV